MEIVLLGPVGAFDHAKPVDISGVRLRMLLARLALEAGRPVSADALIDDLWGEQAPSGAASALQALVYRLRKALGEAGTLTSVAGGYRLSARTQDVDALRFEELAAQGRRELAAGRHEEAAAVLGAALGLWRGAALADVLDAPFAPGVAARLDEVRASAVEDRFDAALRLGGHAEALAGLAVAGAEHPLSERLAGLRMRALSATGRQSDALAVFEEIRGRLAEELGVDPSTELREIHLALLRGELAPPSARAEAVPCRLPAQLSSFVGRERELEQLAVLMDSSRLVTIVGPGGAGKTRLSIEAAARDRRRAWFVPLAGVTAPDQLADAMLGALSSQGQTQQATPVDRLAELLDVGEAVLILDNCEHVLDAAAELAHELLDRLPQLGILATSREPLAITGEALCHLGPLELPSRPADAAESAAVRLFVDRATGVRPDFVLDGSTVGAVVEICCRLDGLPLALELAAAKLRAMSVNQVAQRLDDRFRLLTSGSRTALPRQRTLLAVVEWSWDLLEEAERVLARRLSAFPGGATLAALEAVCAGELLPAGDIPYLLDALVEKSLLSTSDEPRFRMLETVRAYGAARLAESGEDLSARFVAYFLALAEEHEPLLRTGGQLDAIALFDAEHGNLVAALRMAVAAGDGATASRFVGALFWYWGIRGMCGQFGTFLSEVRRLGHELPDHALATMHAVRLAASGPAVDSAAAREFHPALPLVRMSLAAGGTGHAEPRDAWARASAHWARDVALTEQGELAAGAHDRREALRGFEEVGDRWGLVMSLLPLSRDHSLLGEYGQAIALLERAVAISSELGAEDYLYLTRARLARERRRSGDLDGALCDILVARRQAAEKGHRRLEANILVGLANLQRRAGELERADRTLDELESLAIPEDLARDLIVSTRMENRLAEGAAAEARLLLPQAAGSLFAQGSSAGLAWAAELLGGVLALEGDPSGAATALGMSQAIRGAFDHGEPELRELAVRLTGKLGEPGYERAYRLGADLPRKDALTRLAGATAP
ncbi:BTAD domain-containing putative transcriptional regulator [Nonomuraea sp. NPDC050556]|uniref:BTAD domain-containing putative transcriptional regulator n=1 Tax=Nonomuraea sp. NPDC050556 TaxID=3364369 RepID=UPI00378DD8D8